MARCYYTYDRPFALESGETLPSLRIAYDTYGTMNAARDNVVWVCHALTADSDVAGWWPRSVERGRFLDPERYFVVCANILGSHYGTTGPLSPRPADGRAWFGDFPRITVRDMVRCHRLLAAHLGIERAACLVGGSIGGFQALEWCVADPDFARRAVFIATSAQAGAWVAAFDESQRMAIEADPTFGSPCADAGAAGLAAARSIALLSYRNAATYDRTQADAGRPASACFDRRASGYQRYQGEKLCRRFDAYSYYRLTQAIDSHDVGRGRGGVAAALRSIRARTLVAAVSTDLLFSVGEHRAMADAIPGAEYRVIDSDYGHDGFLIEYEQVNRMMIDFMR